MLPCASITLVMLRAATITTASTALSLHDLTPAPYLHPSPYPYSSTPPPKQYYSSKPPPYPYSSTPPPQQYYSSYDTSSHNYGHEWDYQKLSEVQVPHKITGYSIHSGPTLTQYRSPYHLNGLRELKDSAWTQNGDMIVGIKYYIGDMIVGIKYRIGDMLVGIKYYIGDMIVGIKYYIRAMI